MDKARLVKDFNGFFGKSNCDVSEEDYKRFEYHKKLLIQLSEVENSSMAVYDMYRGGYAFVRSKFDQQLNYPLNEGYKKDPNYFMQLMPPDDLKFTLDTIKKTFAFLDTIDKELLKDYKLIFEYRMADPAGNLHRFLQQCVVIEPDENGCIWMVLIINDLIPNKQNDDILLRKVIHMPTNRICLFQDDDHQKSNSFLSKREIEILGLISEGLQSKEISDRLFISVNTVNNHRQRIIEKTNSDNTNEALNYAKIIGII
jgi:DNA-binding CsgD family transcriptional regulator